MAGDTASQGALAGLTVLEIGARIGASVAGSLLAQLGADVVFLEGTGASGFAQPKWWHRDTVAAGKRSLLFSPTDGALLEDLAGRADVVLLSSDVDRLAYGTQPLPRGPETAVLCDLTAFGSSGPWHGRPATDAQVQALCGVMDATGVADGPPMPLAVPLIEQLAGVYAAAGVLAALHGGVRAPVEVALYDVGFSAMTSFLAPAFHDAGQAQATRVGNRHTMAAPWNVYRARDGWVLLCAGNDEQWQRICALIGCQDARLARNADRVAHADAVDALVQAWVGQHPIADCVQQLSASGIACGPVAPLQDHPREANLAHRRMARAATAPDGRNIFLPASPLRMDCTPGVPLLHVPAPDADRSAIARGLPAWTARRAAAARRSAADTADAARPLAGLRVIEIGHYTTAPVAARLLAALGAEVIKIEPPEGEAVRRWPPMRNGQGVFFTFQNADKRSLVLDLQSAAGMATLDHLLTGADMLVENLRPGALARKGLSPAQLRARHPRLVYCAISGFGADSLYPGRAAFDTVIQAMSGMMALHRVGDDVPLKTGPSMADVIGAAMGLMAVLAALRERAHSGTGQAIDLSMQDICAWALQCGWNGAAADGGGDVVPRPGGWAYATGDGDEVPVLPIHAVVRAPQTEARQLWGMVSSGDAACPTLASPVRLGTAARDLPRPGPALGRDTDAILAELAGAFGDHP